MKSSSLTAFFAFALSGAVGLAPSSAQGGGRETLLDLTSNFTFGYLGGGASLMGLIPDEMVSRNWSVAAGVLVLGGAGQLAGYGGYVFADLQPPSPLHTWGSFRFSPAFHVRPGARIDGVSREEYPDLAHASFALGVLERVEVSLAMNPSRTAWFTFGLGAGVLFEWLTEAEQEAYGSVDAPPLTPLLEAGLGIRFTVDRPHPPTSPAPE